MNQSQSFVYTGTCRLCLATNDCCFHIFSKWGHKRQIKMMIQKLLPIPQVQENDYYSKFICLECFSKLNNFFEFSKTCVNSDITMRNIHNPETPLSQDDDTQYVLERNSLLSPDKKKFAYQARKTMREEDCASRKSDISCSSFKYESRPTARLINTHYDSDVTKCHKNDDERCLHYANQHVNMTVNKITKACKKEQNTFNSYVSDKNSSEEEFDFDKLFTADNFTPSEQDRCDDDDDSACDMSKSHDKKRPHRGDEHQYNLRNRKMHENRQISPFKLDPFKPNDEFHSPHYKNDLRKDSMAPQYCNTSDCKELGGNITPTSNRCIMGKKSNNDPTKDVSPPCLWRKHFHRVSNSEGGENSSKPQQTPEPRQSNPWLESGTTPNRNSGIVAEILKKEERMVMETTPLYGCKGCGPNHIQNPNLDNKGEPKCKFDQPKEEDKMNVFMPKETSNTRYTPREHNSVNITPLLGSLHPNLLGDGKNYLNVTPPYRWGNLQKHETPE